MTLRARSTLARQGSPLCTFRTFSRTGHGGNTLWAATLAARTFDQLEPLFDALDEVYASWMRDIRLGKARILAGRNSLQDNGLGQGATTRP